MAISYLHLFAATPFPWSAWSVWRLDEEKARKLMINLSTVTLATTPIRLLTSTIKTGSETQHQCRVREKYNVLRCSRVSRRLRNDSKICAKEIIWRLVIAVDAACNVRKLLLLGRIVISRLTPPAYLLTSLLSCFLLFFCICAPRKHSDLKAASCSLTDQESNQCVIPKQMWVGIQDAINELCRQQGTWHHPLPAAACKDPFLFWSSRWPAVRTFSNDLILFSARGGQAIKSAL
ncbi:hypothetical protein GE09DRAFT_250767 [Coniochaeta sp. 2T2.1]|nr:hypothetical protein GE09DRAFT_250767 [Coniochaeta sp. 2T2.1]